MTRSIQPVFHRRVMQRVIPAFLLIFGLTTLIAVALTQLNGRAEVRARTQVTVETLERELRTILRLPTEDLTTLAASLEARAFARLTIESTQLGLGEEQRRRIRQDLLDRFNDLISRNRDRYLSIRFITLEGQIWGEAINVDGQINLNDALQEVAFTVDPTYREALQGEPGTVFLSTITRVGSNPEGSLYIYAPVSNLEETNLVLGLVQLEVSALPFTNVLDTALNNATLGLPGRSAMLINNNNSILLRRGELSIDSQTLTTVLAETPGDLLQFPAADSVVLSSSSGVSYPGVDTPWRLLLQDDLNQALRVTNLQTLAAVIGVAGSTLLFFGAIYLILRAQVQPLSQAVQEADRLARLKNAPPSQNAGKARVSAPAVNARAAVATSPTRETVRQAADEITQLIGTIDDISAYIQQLQTSLDTEAQRRQRDLQVAIRIERETAGIREVDALLQKTVNTLCEVLELYHGQVYLLDETTQQAMLTYSRGRLGQRWVAEKVPLPLTTRGIVATAIRRAEATLRLGDAFEEADNVHRMPDVKARLVVPLVLEQDVIGALDLQSELPDGITDSDVPTFQLIATQLTTALGALRELGQMNRRLQQMDLLNRQLTRMAWDEAKDERRLETRYQYSAAAPASNGDGGSEAEEGALSTPITVRGEVIGELSAQPGGQAFTEGDVVVMRAVAERVALAIENARLFQETQSSLQETSTLYQLSRYLNEADTLADIVQSIIYAVMPDSAGGQIWIYDEYASMQGPEWMELVADLAIIEREAVNRDLTGLRLHVPDHPFLTAMQFNQVTLVMNLARDTRLDDRLRTVFRRVNAQSLVIIPLTVRGARRGLITVEYDKVREFSESEGRTLTALIDQAGVAIENRLLLKQTETALTQQQNLYAASRRINGAQEPKDLVNAAVAINADPSLVFSLSLLEGDLDETGWPTKARVVARSEGMMTHEVDEPYSVFITPDSPMRNREPEIVVDADASEAKVTTPVRWIRSQGYRFMAVFPLFSANQPIALFQIASAQLRELDANEYVIYRALTGQMSSQLQIRNLLISTRQALDDTRRLYAASRAIATASDSLMVYQAAIEHLARPLLQAPAPGTSVPDIAGDNVTISVLLAWPDATPYAPYLEYVYNWSSDHDTNPASKIGLRLETSAYPYGRLTEDAESVVYVRDVVRNRSTHDLLREEPELQQRLLEQGIGSIVIVPVQTRMRWFGVLLAQSSQPEAFSESYLRFLQAVTDQVSIAVENQRLFAEAQNEARRAQAEAQRALALAEAAQLANRIGSDFRRSLGDVFERVAEEAGFDRWMLLLKTESGQALERVTAVAPGYNPDEDFRLLDLNLELPVVDAARINRPLIVNDLRHYPSFRGFGTEQHEMLEARYGKHVVVPVNSVSDNTQVLGSLMLGRSIDSEDLDERDEQLGIALAVQVAVALESRRLFERVQSEQQTLRSILSTLPVGVLVLDAESLLPLQFNDQAEFYLRRKIDLNTPFSIEGYNLYRTGTQFYYPMDEMPIYIALRQGRQFYQDDVALIIDGEQTDLLVNAAPILDSQGDISAIVAAFQDISNLRSLENTLQENLRETVAVSEAQRLLSEAGDLDEVLDVVMEQIALNAPTNAMVLLTDEGDALAPLKLGKALEQPEIEIAALTELLDDYETIIIQDTEGAVLNDSIRLTLASIGMRGFMSLPLRARSNPRPLGWLVVMSAAPNYFAPDITRQLDNLNDVVASAIDNRQLIRSQRSALQEASSLYQATNTISRASTLADLAPALQNALEVLAPDYAIGYLNPAASTQSSGVLFTITPAGLPSREVETVLIDLEAAIRAYDLPSYGVFIEDVAQGSAPDLLQRDLLENGFIRSMAAIPLRVKNQPEGWLVVAYEQPRKFGQSDERYLSTVADSASVVIDNIVLFEQIQSSLFETSTLYQASRALKDAATTEEILDVITTYLIQPHITSVHIILLKNGSWHTPGAVAELVNSWVRDTEDTQIRNFRDTELTEDTFPAWSLLETRSVLTIDDIYDAPWLDPSAQVGIQSLDARSLVSMPLRAPKRDIGVIWLGSREPYTHTDRDLRIFQAFAEQASLSLEAAYLLAQTERRARQLETSAQVSQSASTILDLQVLMPRLVNLIKDAFGYDHVQIFLMDEDDQYALLRASTGEAGRQLLAINHKLKKGSRSVIGQVTTTGRPQIALDTTSTEVVHLPNPLLPDTRSEMALPLIIKGQVVGALDVQSNQPNAFGDEDVNVLTTLAAQISIAIENARLYEGAQQQADRMGFLFDITNTAAGAETLDQALQNVAERMYTSLAALSVTIYVSRVYTDHEDNILRTVQAVAMAGSEQPLSEIEEIREGDSSNLIGSLLSDHKPRVIDSVAAETRYLPVMPGARSAILIPLLSGAELIGLVNVEDDRPAAFPAETQQLLFTMARTLSAIVQSARLLEQLQKSNEQLRELDRLKSDFLANMSHELRTPLNSIIGFSRVMLKGIDGSLTEMQEQDLTTIYNSGQHLLMLINDILDQAKIAAGKMDLKLAYFDIKPLVDGVRSIGIGLVKDKPISLQMEMANNLPRAYGDEFRIRQVMLNLVSNASKFTNEGTVTIRVYPAEDSGRSMIRVDVIDTGIGIAEKDLPLLFEAFRQVDSSLTRTQGGTGLGLPIAKSLIELQGGKMLVKSQVNIGSTFSILVPTEPMENPDEDDDNTPVPSHRPANQEDVNPSTRPTLEVPTLDATPSRRPDALSLPFVNGPSQKLMQAKRQVLLIEDNKDMVDQFRRILQREGFDVQTADHPAYAEAMASNLRPTVIVMDVGFAGGEGWNILGRLKDRDDTFDIPVIVVTLSDQSERAYQMGTHRFIQRPFMPDDLVKAVLEAEKESNTERILIIDDQPDDVRLLTQVLNESGSYRVFAAHSGIEGISLVARRRPDLIILDLRMPDMDGFAVLNELRSNPETANIPVLVVTGEINLNAQEQQQLANVRILQKTSISQEEYEQFIADVQNHLDGGSLGNGMNGH
ncbi:MAG: GAF domain-containing protein [bacterium]|nr:GAF domain-containing protein [bacterium]